MPSGLAFPVRRNIMMRRTRCVQERSHINVWWIGSERLPIVEALANLSNRGGNDY
jgi:hypothetical protein